MMLEEEAAARLWEREKKRREADKESPTPSEEGQ
jgi:hypothetical protein